MQLLNRSVVALTGAGRLLHALPWHGMLRGCHACRGGGQLVLISSLAGVLPSPGQAVYSAAKAGLNSYFLSLSSELRSR